MRFHHLSELHHIDGILQLAFGSDGAFRRDTRSADGQLFEDGRKRTGSSPPRLGCSMPAFASQSFRVSVRRSSRSRQRLPTATGIAAKSEQRANNTTTAKNWRCTPDKSRLGWWFELGAWWSEQTGMGTGDLANDASSSHLSQMLSAIVHNITESATDESGTIVASMESLRKAGVPIVSTFVGAQGMLVTRLSQPDEPDRYMEMAHRLSTGDALTVESLTWSLILHVEVGKGSAQRASHEALANLLLWVRQRVNTYPQVEVGCTRAAWSRSFQSGLAWAALLHSHDERLLTYEDLRDEDVSAGECLSRVCAAARQHLGVQEPSSGGRELAQLIEDEPRVAILYTARLRNAIQREEAQAQLRNAMERARKPPYGQKSITMLEQLWLCPRLSQMNHLQDSDSSKDSPARSPTLRTFGTTESDGSPRLKV